MTSLSHRGRRRRWQCTSLSRKIRLKLGQLRRDRSFGLVPIGQYVGSLESVAGNAEHGCFIRQNAVLLDQLARGSNRYAARGFGKDALSLGQQLDAADNFGIGNVFRPSPAFGDGLQGVVSVSR